MPGKTIAVLGGGVGGLVAANRLRRLLPRGHRIVLIDRTVWHSFAPAFTSIMLGRKGFAQISRDLRRLERKGIEFKAAEITAIDPSRRTVHLDGEELSCDYIVLSLGAQYSVGGISGLATGYTFYAVEAADSLREELEGFKAGRIALVVAGTPYKCPAAPYEGALLIDEYFRRRGARDEVEIRVYTPEPQPLPIAGKAVGEAVTELLAGREVWFSPNARLQSVDPDGKKLAFQDGIQAPYDLLIAVPVHEVPTVVSEAGLVGEGGWVAVDRETLATDHEGVYAIGDMTQIPLSNGLMLPKAGVFAHGEAEVVARNIAAEVSGGEGIWAFGGEGACFLETGYGKAAYVKGQFFAEPDPHVTMRPPRRWSRWEKEGFVRSWLWRWF